MLPKFLKKSIHYIQADNKKNLFFTVCIFCGYGLFCVLLKISEFKELFDNKKVFSSFSLIDYLFHPVLLKDALWYTTSFLMVHILTAIICWFLAVHIIRRSGSDARIRKLSYSLFVTGFLYLVYVFNAVLYPNTGMFRPNMLHLLIADALLAVFVLSIIFLFVRLIKKTMALRCRRVVKYTCIVGACCLSFFAAQSMVESSRGKDDSEDKLPNIIIIGIDSLAPTLTGIDKKYHNGSSITLNIDRFLDNATVFENAWTPLSRTYPAWMSLLTGTYPIRNGARYNLIDPDLLNKNNVYLAKFLKQQGYQTLYGSDEKRFANIDQHYGFDTLIGPKMGAADFLLAPILDTPLTNLLINTHIGKLLFPYNHSNRAIHATYQPETFIRNVKRSIDNLTDKPVFLSLHLCLPHWPYTWAQKENPFDIEPYLTSIARADIQFGNLIKALGNQLFENALVFVISDHGESQWVLNEEPGGFLSETGNVPLPVRMLGHGSYVVDKTQSRILMGVRGFGNVRNAHRVTPQPAALIDVFPTILEMMGIKNTHQEFDGISLAPWILQQESPPVTDRYLFFESGYNPGLFMSVKKMPSNQEDLGNIVATGIGSYRIKRNGRIVLKKEVLKELYTEKQYAVFNKDRAVALIPDENGIRMLVGINYEEKTWTQLTPKTSDSGVYSDLLYKLCEKYILE